MVLDFHFIIELFYLSMHVITSRCICIIDHFAFAEDGKVTKYRLLGLLALGDFWFGLVMAPDRCPLTSILLFMRKWHLHVGAQLVQISAA